MNVLLYLTGIIIKVIYHLKIHQIHSILLVLVLLLKPVLKYYFKKICGKINI